MLFNGHVVTDSIVSIIRQKGPTWRALASILSWISTAIARRLHPGDGSSIANLAFFWLYETKRTRFYLCSGRLFAPCFVRLDTATFILGIVRNETFPPFVALCWFDWRVANNVREGLAWMGNGKSVFYIQIVFERSASCFQPAASGCILSSLVRKGSFPSFVFFVHMHTTF